MPKPSTEGNRAGRSIPHNHKLKWATLKIVAAQTNLLAAYLGPSSRLTDALEQLPLIMATGEAHFIQDEPVRLDGEEVRLFDMLDHIAEPSQSKLIFVTPYLIPVKGSLEELAKTAGRGVRVKILTSSMGANNHTAAHSHYKKYRRPILATGADLFEFRHDPSQSTRDVSNVDPIRAEFISLHIKAIVSDRERCFVGSLNLDPRALDINTENGLYFDSPGLCGQLAKEFEALMAPDDAWRSTSMKKTRFAGNPAREPPSISLLEIFGNV